MPISKTAPTLQMLTPLVRAAAQYFRLPIGAGVGTAAAPGNGTSFYMHFMSAVPCTLSEVGVEVVTTPGGVGSVHRIGFRQDNAGLPGTLITDFGTVATTATGVALITGLTTAIKAGTLYWFEAVPQGAPTPTPTLRITSATSPFGANAALYGGQGPQSNGGAVTGALPTNPNLSTSFGGSNPALYVKLAL